MNTDQHTGHGPSRAGRPDDRRSRFLLGLVVPPLRSEPVIVRALEAASSVAISDAVGGGLIEEVLTSNGPGGEGRYVVYADATALEDPERLERNPRATTLAVELGVSDPAVLNRLRGTLLILGRAADDCDQDVPSDVLRAAGRRLPLDLQAATEAPSTASSMSPTAAAEVVTGAGPA